MKKLFLTSIGILILMVACKQKEIKRTEITNQKPIIELKAETEKPTKKIVTQEQNIDNKYSQSKPKIGVKEFNQNLIKQLYSGLKSDFEIGFEQSHLENLLIKVKISELENGKEFEKKMLFENFKCDCYDKMRISYSKSKNRFIFFVYEEFYDKDLDWCPESSYNYSFKIDNSKITDLKLDFMAG